MPTGDLSATLWEKLVDDYQGKADKYETRESQYGCHKAMIDDTSLIDSNEGIIAPSERALIQKAGYSSNGVAIPVMDNGTYTISASSFSTCTATQEGNDSAELAVTYSTISTEFFMPVNKGNYNYVTPEDYFTKSVKNLGRDINVYINSLSFAALTAARGQYQGETLGGYFTDSTDDSFSVTDATKDTLMLNLRTLYNTEDYTGNFRIIGNPLFYRDAVYPQFAQGTGNATNTNYQFGGSPAPNVSDGAFGLGMDFAFYSDNAITNIASHASTAFVAPVGSTAIVNSVSDDFTNMVARDLKTVTRTETIFPDVMGNYNWGMRVSEACTDGVDGISYQWETKLAFITPYQSAPTTVFAPINRFEIANPV